MHFKKSSADDNKFYKRKLSINVYSFEKYYIILSARIALPLILAIHNPNKKLEMFGSSMWILKGE